MSFSVLLIACGKLFSMLSLYINCIIFYCVIHASSQTCIHVYKVYAHDTQYGNISIHSFAQLLHTKQQLNIGLYKKIFIRKWNVITICMNISFSHKKINFIARIFLKIIATCNNHCCDLMNVIIFF